MGNAAYPAVADPETCGEDLPGNAERTFAIAGEHCGDCVDYHVVKSVLRVSGNTVWEQGARPYLLRTLNDLFAGLKKSGAEPIDVAIAACADTAVLSACAHAAFMAGEGTLERTRFTVFDKCGTPLTLCDEFGERHGLTVRTQISELTDASNATQANIVVVHNLLAFIPQERHRRLMINLRSWLKDGGRVVLYVPFHSPSSLQRADLRKQKRKDLLRTLVADGKISIGEPLDTFLARLDRNVDGWRPAYDAFPDAQSVWDFVESTGLEIRSVTDVDPFHGTANKVVIVAGNPGG